MDVKCKRLIIKEFTEKYREKETSQFFSEKNWYDAAKVKVFFFFSKEKRKYRAFIY